jgi:hypothetical protein
VRRHEHGAAQQGSGLHPAGMRQLAAQNARLQDTLNAVKAELGR